MKKNIFIMGDSYSTYKGDIPEGYDAYYADGMEIAPVVRGAERTWWKIFERENDLNIVLNDSYSGSTVCNTVRPGLGTESSFIRRMEKYISEGFFEKNKIDTMFIFGGTNDSWIDAPIGKVKYSDWTAEELDCALPAFCYLLNCAKTVVGEVVAIINTELKEEITEGFIAACKENNVKCAVLHEIDKDSGHPTETGMKQIAAQVAEIWK